MSQVELLGHVVATLERSGIGYLITGSIASSLQGEPRATHDLDVVVAIEESHVAELLAAFPRPRYYVNEPAVRQAIRERGMFNVIDAEEGGKVDFWMLTDEPFDRSRFSRRMRKSALGLAFDVSSPEDTILAKLRWSRLAGDSSKTYTDALRVYEVQAGLLDRAYMADWAIRLGVTDLWERIRREAEPI